MANVDRRYATQWAKTNPILGDGEIGQDISSGRIKVGDGARRWLDLSFLPSTTAGDIPGSTTAVDLSPYAKKTDLNGLLTSSALTPYAKTQDLTTVLKSTDVESVDLTGFAKSADLTTVLKSTDVESVDMTAYVKLSDLAAYAKTTDLSAYAKKVVTDYLDGRIAVLETKAAVTPPAAPAGSATRPASLATTAQPNNWLKPETLTGADGDSITTWTGTSATANVNTTSSGTAPKLLASVFNGRNGLRFTKAAISKMDWGPSAGAIGTNQTIFVVARHPVLANAGFLVHGVNTGVSPNAAARMAVRAQVTTAGLFTGGPFGATGATFSTMASPITANTWNIFCIEFTTGSLPTVWVNGVQGSTGVGSTDTALTLTTLALGGYGTGSSDVDYMELARWTGQISAADRTTAFQYFSTTHNIGLAA